MPISTDDFDKWERKVDPAHHEAPLADVDTSGMPTFARLRLQEHVKNRRAPFTSNLSVNELLLARRLGFTPVAQVIGASVYHVGWNWMPVYAFQYAQEMDGLTHARMEAWQFAVSRLEQQARVSGCHAVVGVRLEHRGLDMQFRQVPSEADANVIEVFLAGTSVRFDGDTSAARPLLSSLSAQDFMALRGAGHYPVGLAYGCCVYYQPSFWSFAQGTGGLVAWGTQYQNQELTDYTLGFQNARRIAVSRLYDQAAMLGGTGVLDVSIRNSVQETEHDINDQKQAGVIITFEAVGTAVVEIDEGPYPKVHQTVDLGG